VFTASGVSLIVPDAPLREALDALPLMQRLRSQHGRSRLLILMDDHGPARTRGATPARRLTRQELAVLIEVASGRRTADIARALRRSPKTVEKHRTSLQRKLGLRGVAQVTAYAIMNGLVAPEAVLAADPDRARGHPGG
jgi:DNA-binding NarL/FixJ family response regulator